LQPGSPPTPATARARHQKPWPKCLLHHCPDDGGEAPTPPPPPTAARAAPKRSRHRAASDVGQQTANPANPGASYPPRALILTPGAICRDRSCNTTRPGSGNPPDANCRAICCGEQRSASWPELASLSSRRVAAVAVGLQVAGPVADLKEPVLRGCGPPQIAPEAQVGRVQPLVVVYVRVGLLGGQNAERWAECWILTAKSARKLTGEPAPAGDLVVPDEVFERLPFPSRGPPIRYWHEILCRS
jgi:hypothetical protein